MKLLSKSEVESTKTEEKRREIEQGMNLARKIDVLRETAVVEEKTLTDLRTGATSLLAAEIKEKKDEIEDLDGQILLRQEELEELRKPLDAEWKILQHAKDAFTASVEDHNARTEAEDRERLFLTTTAQGSFTKAQATLLAAEEKESRASTMLQKAIDDTTSIEKQLKLSTERLNAIDEEILNKESTLKRREDNVTRREEEATLKESSLNHKERELTLKSRRYAKN